MFKCYLIKGFPFQKRYAHEPVIIPENQSYFRSVDQTFKYTGMQT